MRKVDVVDVHATAPGYLPTIERLDPEGAWEPPHLRIALRRGEAPPALAGHVRGGPGAVVEARAREPRYGAPPEDGPVTGGMGHLGED